MKLSKRKSNRCKNWDYSSNGYYFITLLIDKRFCFGKIINNRVVLNELGIITKRCWLDIPKFCKNIELDEFVVMPDHFHGIVKLFDLTDEVKNDRTKMYLSRMVRSFKVSVAKNTRQKIWKRSFFDKVIRDERHLEDVRNYIANNPENFKNSLQD